MGFGGGRFSKKRHSNTREREKAADHKGSDGKRWPRAGWIKTNCSNKWQVSPTWVIREGLGKAFPLGPESKNSAKGLPVTFKPSDLGGEVWGGKSAQHITVIRVKPKVRRRETSDVPGVLT